MLGVLRGVRHLQPFEAVDNEGNVYYPTRAKVANWYRGVMRPGAVDIEVVETILENRIPKFDDLELAVFGDIYSKRTLSAAEVLRDLVGLTQTANDGTERVEWMRYSLADFMVLQARLREYANRGSQMVGGSSDGFYPGVVAEDIYIRGTPGYEVNARGYVPVLGSVRFNLPALGKADGISRNILSWAGMSYLSTWQHSDTLLKWRSLASTPIERSIGFFMDSAGHTAPLYVVMNPPLPSPVVTNTIVISSNANTKLTMRFRDPSNYTSILASRELNIGVGQTRIVFRLVSFPYVTPLVVQLAVDDNVQASLNKYTVSIL